jgi:hypothetical protein
VSDDIINEDKIQKAVAVFEGEELAAPEALLASARLFAASLSRFRKEAPDYRKNAGEEATRRFATEHLNEVIYDLQDAVPVAVRVFNSLMRDPEDNKAGPPE